MCSPDKPSLAKPKPIISEPVNPAVADIDLGLTGEDAKKRKRQKMLGSRQLAIPTGSSTGTAGGGPFSGLGLT